MHRCKICKKISDRKRFILYCSNKCNQAAYYLRTRNDRLTRSKTWNATNKDAMKLIRRRWRDKNAAKNRLLANDWAKKNKDYVLHNATVQSSKRRGAVGSHTLSEWRKVKEKFNFTCNLCGRPEPAIKLTKDHIIPIKRGGSNFIENIQPLCFSCNASKGAR